MKIWGGWLPFVGFRAATLPVELAREFGIHAAKLVPGSMNHIQTEELAVEWFGCGAILAVRANRTPK